MPNKRIDLSDRILGRLKVLGPTKSEKKQNKSRLFWLCRCECGTEVWALSSQLIKGSQRSCGCLRTENVRTMHLTHGLTGTGEYESWAGMVRRCTNSESVDFPHYGGRGITICDRWKNDVHAFIADMGKRPKAKSIGRIDNDGNYTPENCRWETATEQLRNTTRTHWITFKGETLSLAEWAERLGLSYVCLFHRIERGWELERALTL